MTFQPRYREKLTGQARCRLQWLTRKAVLQVEVLQQCTSDIPGCPPPPGCADRDAWNQKQAAEFEKSWKTTNTYFRDAKATEVVAPRLFGLNT